LPLRLAESDDYSGGTREIATKKMSGDPLSGVGGSTPEGISRSTAIMYIYGVAATAFFV
jgi:hypothetical protein